MDHGQPRHARPGSARASRQTRSIGWGVLAEVPGREIVMGAVTQPWLADVVFRTLPPDTFAAFAEPDYVKIVWTLRSYPIGDTESVFRTETRVSTTSPARAREVPTVLVVGFARHHLDPMDVARAGESGSRTPDAGHLARHGCAAHVSVEHQGWRRPRRPWRPAVRQSSGRNVAAPSTTTSAVFNRQLSGSQSRSLARRRGHAGGRGVVVMEIVSASTSVSPSTAPDTSRPAVAEHAARRVTANSTS